MIVFQREILAKNLLLEEQVRNLQEQLSQLEAEKEENETRLTKDVKRLQTEKDVGNIDNFFSDDVMADCLTFLLAFQVFANLVETLRSSRVTIDDQPMVSSVLRKDNEDLRSRVELQEKELAKSKHTKSMLEQQVCVFYFDDFFLFIFFLFPSKIYFSVFPFRLQFFKTTCVIRSILF